MAVHGVGPNHKTVPHKIRFRRTEHRIKELITKELRMNANNIELIFMPTRQASLKLLLVRE